jgi:hypothetical protein
MIWLNVYTLLVIFLLRFSLYMDLLEVGAVTIDSGGARNDERGC